MPANGRLDLIRRLKVNLMSSVTLQACNLSCPCHTFFVVCSSGYTNMQRATRDSSVTPYTDLVIPASLPDIRILAGDSG